MTSDKPDPVSGVVTIEATPMNFTPNNVEFRLDSSSGPLLAVDDTAPYTVTIDTATLARGTHTVFAQGRDGIYTVVDWRRFTTQLNLVVVLVDDMDPRLMPLWVRYRKRRLRSVTAGRPSPMASPRTRCAARRGLAADRQVSAQHRRLRVPRLPPVHRRGGERHLATRLHAAGYRTGFAGKYLNGYETDPAAVPPGWDEWFGLAGDLSHGYNFSANHDGTMESYGSAVTDYLTDVLAREAVSCLNSTESSDGQPFLLYVAPTAPHAWTPPRLVTP